MAKDIQPRQFSRRDMLRFGLGVTGAIATGGALAACGQNPVSEARSNGGEPTPTPNVTPSVTPSASASVEAPKPGAGAVKEFKNSPDTLAYRTLVAPDPKRAPAFPDVPQNGLPAQVEYGKAWEDGDYFEDSKGDVDLPQFHYRVMTAGDIEINQLGIDLHGDSRDGARTGALAIIINHFGDTAMFRDATVDNGFTVAGRVWDMSKPEKVSDAAQALLDHYTGRMTYGKDTSSNDGANCGVVTGCEKLNWQVVVVGNGKPQTTWMGTYQR